MLIDCHTHTTRHSACSRIEPDTLCRLALERSLDGIVLSEHRVTWDPGELAALRGDFPALAIYSGIEVTVREGYDIVCVSPHPVELKPLYPDLEELHRIIGPYREECFLFVAHAFRYEDIFTTGLRDILAYVDGIEMRSVNILRNGYSNSPSGLRPGNAACYTQARDEYGLIPVFNTDCHWPDAVGSVANDIDAPAPPKDEAGLVGLLRTTHLSEYQNVSRLRQTLARYS